MPVLALYLLYRQVILDIGLLWPETVVAVFRAYGRACPSHCPGPFLGRSQWTRLAGLSECDRCAACLRGQVAIFFLGQATVMPSSVLPHPWTTLVPLGSRRMIGPEEWWALGSSWSPFSRSYSMCVVGPGQCANKNCLAMLDRGFKRLFSIDIKKT